MPIIVLIALFWLIGIPIILLIQLSKRQREIEELSERVTRLERERATALASQFRAETAAEPSRPETHATGDEIAESAPENVSSPLQPLLARKREAIPPQEPPPVIGPADADLRPPLTFEEAYAAESHQERVELEAEESKPFNMEQFLGAKLFAWVGGIALFFGMAFFIKYSFERNLIPPVMRILLGGATGVGLILGGARMRNRAYRVTAQTLCASGILILYAAAYGAHQLYGLLSLQMAFVLMSCVTASAFWLAIRFDSRPVAILALHGGFLTPLLLRSAAFNAPGLFTYIAILDIGIVALALHRSWSFLPLIGGIGTALYQAYWSTAVATEASLFFGYGMHLGFTAIFGAGLVIAKRLERVEDLWVGSLAASALAAFYFALCVARVGYALPHLPSLYAFIFAVDGVLLVAPFCHAKGRILFTAGGSITFGLLLAIFYSVRAEEALLPSLIAYFVFGVLHGVLPCVLQRKNREIASPKTAEVFALAGLALCFAPMLALPAVGSWFWLGVLLLSLCASCVALLLSAIPMLVAGVVLTVILAGFWLWRLPVDQGAPALLIPVVGGIAFLYWAVTMVAQHRDRVIRTENQTAQAETTDNMSAPFALLLPFMLLAMCVLRFNLPDPSSVFLVGTAILVVGMFGARWVQRYDSVPILGAALAFVETLWLFNHMRELSPAIAFVWFVSIAAIVFAFPLLFVRPNSRSLAAWAAAGLSFPIHFLLFYYLINERIFLVHERSGTVHPAAVLALALALPNIFGLWRVTKLLPASDDQRPAYLAWMGGGALFLLSIALPIQFERQWLTLGWAIEAVALLWLARWAPHRGLLQVAFGLLVAVFIRLTLNPAVIEYQLGAGLPLLNWHLYTYGIAIICMALAARLWEGSRQLAPSLNAIPALWTFAVILSFYLLNIQIADFFDDSRQLTFNFRRNLATGMTYSIAWSCFALGLIAIGIAKRVPACRYAGIALAAVTVLKLFLLDLQNLDAIYRIAAFLVVALVLIGASMLYQRFRPSTQTTN